MEVIINLDLIPPELKSLIHIQQKLYDSIYKCYTASINKLEDYILEPLYMTYKNNNRKLNEYLPGIKSFLPKIIEKKYNITIDHISIIQRDIHSDIDSEIIIEFTFYKQQQKVYVPKYRYFDLSKYEGYHYISDDALSIYSVSTFLDNLQLVNIDGIYGLSLNNLELLEDIQFDIIKLRKNNYISLKGTQEELNAYIELAHFWGGLIKRCETYVVIQNTIDFNMTPEAWYFTNAQRIIKGGLPEYTFIIPMDKSIKSRYLHTGELTKQIQTDWYPNIDYDLIYHKYICVIAYLDLANDYPELYEYIDNIKVNSDMTVSCNFFNYEQSIKYQELLTSNIKTKINYREIKNESEGQYLKEYIEKSAPDVNPIIFNQDGKMYIATSDNFDLDKLVISNPIPITNQITERLIEYKLRNLDGYNIYKDIIDQNICSIKLGITEDKFLMPNKNAYYELPINFYNELSLGSLDALAFEKYEKLYYIYEGVDIPIQEIEKLLKEYKFFSKWSSLVYSKTGKYSRLNVIYHVLDPMEQS